MERRLEGHWLEIVQLTLKWVIFGDEIKKTGHVSAGSGFGGIFKNIFGGLVHSLKRPDPSREVGHHG